MVDPLHSGTSLSAAVDDRRLIEFHQAMLRDLGVSLPPSAKVLDFGCGQGLRVAQYRKAGYQAFGVDFQSDWSQVESFCRAQGLAEGDERVLRALETEPYRIPYPDGFFDFVFSEQVFEHVQDYGAAIAEIRRVLRPGGFTLNDFPSRLRPIEAHVHVPFAGIFRSRAYLRAWARLGIRNEFQQGLDAEDVAERNFRYLHANTNYLTGRQVYTHFAAFFPVVRFAESLFLQHSWGRIQRIARIGRILPQIGNLVGAFHTRVVFCRRI